MVLSVFPMYRLGFHPEVRLRERLAIEIAHYEYLAFYLLIYRGGEGGEVADEVHGYDESGWGAVTSGFPMHSLCLCQEIHSCLSLVVELADLPHPHFPC